MEKFKMSHVLQMQIYESRNLYLARLIMTREIRIFASIEDAV
jgi:hypothetical protein